MRVLIYRYSFLFKEHSIRRCILNYTAHDIVYRTYRSANTFLCDLKAEYQHGTLVRIDIVTSHVCHYPHETDPWLIYRRAA